MHNCTHTHKQTYLSDRSPTCPLAVRHKPGYTLSSSQCPSHTHMAIRAASGNFIIGVCVSPLSLPSPRALDCNLIKLSFKRIMLVTDRSGQKNVAKLNCFCVEEFLYLHSILFFKYLLHESMFLTGV